MQIVPNWCEKCEFDERDGGEEPCVRCTVCGDNKPTQFKPKKPPSNADRIRAMMDEELAEYIRVFFPEVCPPGKCPGEDYCYKCWLDWLKEEAID